MPAFCRIYLVPIQSSLHLHRELKTTHIFLQMWRKIYLYFNVSLSCVLRSTCCWFQVGCLSYGILFFLVFRSYIAPKQAASILNTFPITSLARGQLWSYVSVVRAHLHRLSPAPVRLLCITTCLLVGHHWDRSNQQLYARKENPMGQTLLGLFLWYTKNRKCKTNNLADPGFVVRSYTTKEMSE